MKKRLRHTAYRPVFSSFIYFLIGAFGYGSIELLWRGHTHSSMLLLGGACLLVLRAIDQAGWPLGMKCCAGALAITALELATGIIVNVGLGLAVWDYSARWMNLLGQVCPLFTALWFLLCAGVFAARSGRDALIRAILRGVAEGKAVSAPFIPEEGNS